MLKNWPYKALLLKRRVESCIIYPFILLGRIIAHFYPIGKQYRTYYFFPFYHIGGAEKVHAQITQATGGNDCIIFFTRKSHNTLFQEEFKKSGCTIKDISTFTDNKWLYFLNLTYRGIISAYINKQHPLVFNGQCNFGYKISPWLNKSIVQVELIHSFNSFSYIRIPFLPFIAKTIMISRKKISEHLELYHKIGVPDHFRENIAYIPNAIPLPEKGFVKDFQNFQVLYVGRGGEEKRVHLIAEIARIIHSKNLPITFNFLGDVSEILDQQKYPFINFYGNQSDAGIIEDQYKNASILILTSTTEGFPLVVMEAMVNGCIVLSTPVGDIPYHIQPAVNGYLFSTIENEKLIIEEAYTHILDLYHHQDLCHTISSNNIAYANKHFNIKRLNEAYKALFNSLKK